MAKAVRPSSESLPAVWKGSSTDATCGWRSILASAVPMSRLGPGCSSAPLSVLKTTTACVPDWASKRSSRRSCACWDSMPGTVKSSLKLPPTATAPPITAVTVSSTARVAARGRRPTRDAMWERRVVMAGTIPRLSLEINCV